MPSSTVTTPFISDESMNQALDSLLYTSSASSPSPLTQLLLVDEVLTDPAIPISDHARDFALQHVLVSFITAALREHRRVWGLNSPSEHSSLQEALTALSDDVRTGNIELVGWSLLYHRYVRVDLSMSVDMLTKATHFDTRTLRRYQRHAIRRLRDQLIAAEWQARVQQRQRRLYAALPISGRVTLIGREALLTEAEILLSRVHPRHLLVIGPAGIGKTVYVQELVRRQIDAGLVDQLIWLDRPASVALVTHELLGQLVVENTSISLREYLLLHRVAVVLDDVERLLDEPAAFEALLDALNSALVCIVNRSHILLRNSTFQQTLPELSETEASVLVYSLVNQARNTSDMWAELALATWKKVGGNPLAVRQTAYALMWYEPQLTSTADPLDYLVQDYDQCYRSLNRELKQLWLSFALLPAGEIDLNMLSMLSDRTLVDAQIGALARRSLIEKSSFELDTYTISTVARSFLRTRCAEDPDAMQIAAHSLERLNAHMTARDPTALKVAWHLLLTGWLEIPTEYHKVWIDLLWKTSIPGQWGGWRSILERAIRLTGEAEAVDLRLLYGICLRRLYEWDSSAQVFQQVVAEAGRLGLFTLQGRALLELGIVACGTGNYGKALALFAQVENVALRYQDVALSHQLYLEYAQLNIDLGDGVAARHYLEQIPETRRVLMLCGEACLLQEQFGVAADLAQRALALYRDEPAVEARIYTTLGRCWERQGVLREAHAYFTLALTLLERLEDSFALARARCNLAAVLIRVHQLQEAQRLLKEAERIQVMIADQAGLARTRHNLALLPERFRR